MTENGGIEALTEALKPCASGKRLLGALRSANLAGTEIPGLINDCIAEIKAGSKGGDDPAAALGDKRLSLGGALCVIDGLMFLNPRYDCC